MPDDSSPTRRNRRRFLFISLAIPLFLLFLTATQASATLADLLPQNVSVSPNPATAGGNVTVSYTVRNQGGTAAPASHTRVQIKNSSNVTLADVTFSTSAIGANSSVNENRSMSLAGASAGTYYAYVVVDAYDEVAQSSTSNDGQFNAGISFTVQSVAATLADLLPQSVSVSPNPATAGGNVTVSYTVRNQGGTAAPASHTRVQIKNSSNVTLTDVTFSTSAIGANSSLNENRSMSLAGASAGTYYAYVVVDTYGEVAQSSTSNDGQFNAGVSFTVQSVATTLADLLPQSVSVSPNPATAGGNVTVSYTVRNQGGTAAPASHTRVQIKNASNVTLRDVTFATSAIGANSSVAENRSMSLTGASAGTYYAYVIVDTLGEVTQSSTSNDGQFNAGTSFTVQSVATTLADLLPQSVSVSPNPATAGGSVTVSYTVRNQGGTAAPASRTRVQIKNASNVTLRDVTFATTAIGANSSVNENRSMSLAGASAGTYYAYVIVDTLGEVTQSSTSNDGQFNAGTSFTVQSVATTLADLLPQSVSVSPNPATAGGSVTVSYTVRNQGGTAAPPSHTRVQIKNASNVTVTDTTFATLAIGANSSVLENRSMPLVGASSGTHYAYVVVDTLDEVTQSSTSNDGHNNAGTSFAVQTSGTLDLSVTSPVGGESWTAGTTKTIGWAVTGTALQIAQISYFWVDYSLGGTWVTVPVSRAANSRSLNWTIPSNAESTQARIRVRAMNANGVELLSASSPTFTISPQAGNPVAVPDASNRSPVSGETVYFTSTRSSGSSGGCGIESYFWTFGDGGTSTAANPSHAFTSAQGSRSYTVTLTVTDCIGNTDSKSLTVYVTGQTLGSNQQQTFSADPVNLATGNYIYDHVDLQMPGRGLPFEFKRFYNSKDTQNAGLPLGFGWTHSYNINISVNASNSAVIVFGDGHRETYPTNGVGGYKSEPGIFNSLTNIGGLFTLTTKDQRRFSFDSDGRLSAISDKNGNAITLTYNGPNLSLITDTVGRTIQFVSDDNSRLVELTDPIGRTVRYDYDANGDLITVTDANGGTTRFGYDSFHQKTSAIDPRGNTFVQNEYDEQKRVVKAQKDALQNRTQFEYDFVTRITTVTDANNNKSYHYHDDKLRVISVRDNLGNLQAYEYDASNNRTKVIDKNGKVTRYTYDAMGNVTSKTDPRASVTEIAYDKSNNPVTRVDSARRARLFVYDGKGNLTKSIDSLNKTNQVRYNRFGQPTVITDARGNSSTNVYDSFGNLVAVQDAMGGTNFFTFDGAGRKVRQVDALGRTNTFVYDNADNLLSVVNALGATNSSTYDNNNNRITITDASGFKATNVYDVKDRLVVVRNPLGEAITNEYDALDRKIKVSDAKGAVTFFGYDLEGNLIAATNALGKVTRYTYDANGNRTGIIDPSGGITTNLYDALNRVVQTRDHLGNSKKNVFDALGRKIRSVDAKNRTNHFAYDAGGRLVQFTDAKGGKVTYTYDPVGNRTSVTDPNGNKTRMVYDRLNRLVKRIEASGATTAYFYDAVGNLIRQTDPKGQTISYEYDALNRRTKIIYPTGLPVMFTYDANGNRTSMVDSLGTSTYQYDKLNRLTNFTDCYGKTVRYSYDANGNRATLTYPNDKTVTYAYDSLNRLIKVTDWLNGETSYAYDAFGNLVTNTYPNQTRATYAYDEVHRLTGLTNSAPDSGIISSYAYTLDEVGNHLEVEQEEPVETTPVYGRFSYSYDEDNRMITGEGQPHSYDANGNLTAINTTNLLSYDYENRLIESVLGETTSIYEYNGAGNRMAVTRSGVPTRFVLDVNAALTQVLAETDSQGTVTAYYVYGLGLISKIKPDGSAQYHHYDSRGSTIAMTDEQGQITEYFAYDPFGRVRAISEGAESIFRYLGRHGVIDEGNGFSYIRARYYSAKRGRFLTKDPLTGTDGDSQSLNRYIYALNNPVRLVDISGFSAQESSGTQTLLATSDTSRLHNFLIDPSTAGLATRTANSTPAFLSNGGGADDYFLNATYAALLEAGGKAVDYGTRGFINNNGFNARGAVAFGLNQGAGPLIGGILSARGAYTDTIAHPERSNLEVLARFNTDLATDAVVGFAIVGGSMAAVTLGAPVAIVSVAAVGVTIVAGSLMGTHHDAIQDTVYGWENWVGSRISNLFD